VAFKAEIRNHCNGKSDTGPMANSTVVLGVTGIVVSGVIGPAVASAMARRARTKEFHRDQVAERRNELRTVLDQAATLLAAGPTNLRLLREPGADPEDTRRARAWVSEVFPISQRLQLWLPADHPVVAAYDSVRQQLIQAAQAGPESEDSVLEAYERARDRFLDVSRQTLLSPAPDSGSEV
jgi:hypothetical protein